MDPKRLKTQLKGIMPVQYCPYTEGDELDVDGLAINTEFLVDFAENGHRDLVILANGSTAECYANSIEEQHRVIETVVKASGPVPVIAGVSQAGTRETIRMAQYAEEVGVEGVMVVSPYYATPTTDGLYQHYAQIADSVGVPVIIYNNPDVSGSLMSCDLLQKLAKIDNIVAVKDNSPSAPHYAEMAMKIDPDDMVLISGLGELAYLGAVAYGYQYQGFATFIGNFAPSLAYDIYQATQDRDLLRAHKALKKELPIWEFIGHVGSKRGSASIVPSVLRGNPMYVAVGKAALELVGLRGGRPRPPLESLTDEERVELSEIMKDVGIN